MQEWLDNDNILMYSTHNEGKSVIAEKFIKALTLKRLWGVILTPHPPCDFLKNVSSKESVKPSFFVTFDIIKSHIFREKFIEIPQVVQKL